jgi:membrane-associated protease RseP (regulator of RpoE activity)
VLLQGPADVPGASAPVTARAVAGDTLVAVGGSAAARILVPIVVTAALPTEYRITPADGSVDIGMPLYTDGGAVVAIYAGHGQAQPIMPVLDELMRDAASGARPASIGVTFQRITSELAQALGTNGRGILIAQVMPGGPAAAAGVSEGDVLLTLGGEAVDPERAAIQVRQLEAGAPIRITVNRNRRALALSVTPRPWGEAGTLAAAEPAPLAIELFDARQLSDAQVPEDARVLAIDRRAVRSAAGARRLLSPTRVSLVQFERGEDRFFAALGGSR